MKSAAFPVAGGRLQVLVERPEAERAVQHAGCEGPKGSASPERAAAHGLANRYRG
jgi:hypothetical protein